MQRDHPGPAFLDFPLDVVFMEAEEPPPPDGRPPARGACRRARSSTARSRSCATPSARWSWPARTSTGATASTPCASWRRRSACPCSSTGSRAAACPPTIRCFFSRARSAALKEADVAIVAGVPMDFRLGFGEAFGEETELVAVDLAEPERDHPRPVAAECYGDIAGTLEALAARHRARTARPGSSTCARSRRRSARPSASSWPTTARRCTRCGCTPSSPRCSTATRS